MFVTNDVHRNLYVGSCKAQYVPYIVTSGCNNSCLFCEVHRHTKLHDPTFRERQHRSHITLIFTPAVNVNHDQ